MENPGGFAYHDISIGGPDMVDGLSERRQELHIYGNTGLATYERHRSPSDEPGDPIGWFETKLTPAELADLKSVLDSGVLESLGPTSGGSLSSAIITMTYESADKRVERLLSSGDIEQLVKIRPLIGQFNVLLPKILQHPKAAMRADVRHVSAGKEEHFDIILTNVGKEPIYVANPKLLTGAFASDGNAALVRISVTPEEGSGMAGPAYEWDTTLSPKRPAHGVKEPRHIRLEPGKSFSVPTEPWKRPDRKGVPYTAQAIVEAYAAAPELAKEKVYLVRGGVFSKMIDVPPR